MPDRYANFDGTGYIRFADSGYIDPGDGDWTIIFAIKIRAYPTSGQDAFIEKNKFYCAIQTDGRMRLFLYSGVIKNVYTSAVPLNRWTFVSFVFNSTGDCTPFVGDVQGTGVNVSSVGNLDNSYDLVVGGYYDVFQSSYFATLDGELRGLRIYKKILSPAEIGQIVANGVLSHYTGASGEGGTASFVCEFDSTDNNKYYDAVHNLEGTPYGGVTLTDFVDSYNVYRGQDGAIDYNNPVATMELADTQVILAAQTLPANTIWHYVRRRVKYCCNLESQDSPVCIVRIGDDGEMRGDIPNPPTDLIAEGVAGGIIRLRWRYSAANQETRPAGFAIFISDNETPWDFDNPDGLVESGIGWNNSFSWTSAALTHGKLYRFIVRSYSATGEMSQNTNEVSLTADAVGPAAIVTVLAEWAVN